MLGRYAGLVVVVQVGALASCSATLPNGSYLEMVGQVG